jgi:hypothetical protein
LYLNITNLSFDMLNIITTMMLFLFHYKKIAEKKTTHNKIYMHVHVCYAERDFNMGTGTLFALTFHDVNLTK